MSNNKIICCVCGRQIINYNQTDEFTVYAKSPIRFIGDQYYCKQCSEELDENGNYPDEIGHLLD
jgi:predicted amidophosphoribosyltransferase